MYSSVEESTIERGVRMNKYKYYMVTADAVKAPSFKEMSYSEGLDVVPTWGGGFKLCYRVWACDPNSVRAAFHKQYHDLHLRVIKDSIDFREYQEETSVLLPYSSFTDEYVTNVADLFELAGFDVKRYNDIVAITATTDKQKQIMDNVRIHVE